LQNAKIPNKLCLAVHHFRGKRNQTLRCNALLFLPLSKVAIVEANVARGAHECSVLSSIDRSVGRPAVQ
jgi:hypothetical protein